MFKRLFCCILVFSLLAGLVSAQTCEATSQGRCWYVAPDGDDSNPGTFDQPMKKPQEILKNASAGDVIYLRGGNYTRENAYATGVGQWSDPSSGKNYKFIDFGSIVLPGWATSDGEGEDWHAPSGTEENPIVVKSYPGETAHLHDDGIHIGSLDENVSYIYIEDLKLEGAHLEVAGGNQGAQTHHIYIRGNEIFNFRTDGGSNPGLVKVDRGDWGGPSHIYIENNELHHLSDSSQGPTWDDTRDAQHFGGVTTLSRETYLGYEGGGTGYIKIANNSIHHVPMAFFFKNPMRGPIDIKDNVIYKAQKIGGFLSANIRMINNLFYEVDGGYTSGSPHKFEDDPQTYQIAGHDAHIRYNTFVDMGGLVNIWGAENHSVTNNVISGLTGRISETSWGTSSFITKSGRFPEPMDESQSQLHTVESHSNCLITPYEDFVMAKRFIPPKITGDDWEIFFYNFSEARDTFGFGANSEVVIENNPENVFVNPAEHNYTLKESVPCEGMGYQGSFNHSTSEDTCIAQTEVCNGADDDCDGQVDEGNVCDPSNDNTTDEGPNQTGNPGSVPEDVNGDGKVNIFDLVEVARNIGNTKSSYDLNGDGSVNVFDLISVVQRIVGGASGNSSEDVPVPEMPGQPQFEEVSGGVNVSWNGVEYAEKYNYTSAVENGETMQTSVVLSLSDGDWFCVKAVNNEGEESPENSCNSYTATTEQNDTTADNQTQSSDSNESSSSFNSSIGEWRGNEPSGYTERFNNDHDSLEEGYVNYDGSVSIANPSSEPGVEGEGTDGVMRTLWPSGHPDGSGSGWAAWNGFEAFEDFYTAYTLYLEPGFKTNEQGIKHLGWFWYDASGSSTFIDLKTHGSGKDDPIFPEIVFKGDSGNIRCSPDNPSNYYITRGEWHQLESQIAYNGDGTFDLRSWLDGELALECLDISWPDADPSEGTLNEFKWFNTWGGGGTAQTEDSYIDVGHTYISGK